MLEFPLCACSEVQSLQHITDECLTTKFIGGIKKLHKGGSDALRFFFPFYRGNQMKNSSNKTNRTKNLDKWVKSRSGQDGKMDRLNAKSNTITDKNGDKDLENFNLT